MTISEENKLDNPIWHSLSENHQEFSLDYGNTKFYHPDYGPFGSFTDLEKTAMATQEYSTLIDNFFIVGEKPEIAGTLKIVKELVCLQMVIYKKIQLPIDVEIVKLTIDHNEILCDLVNLVQPGYFKNKTILLGNYYGIFKDHQLIAITGERMKMNAFTEVSAIITHPEHTGKGYAKQLIAHVVNAIFDQGKIPFLHVAEHNLGAIALYEKLGFTTRRKMSFWNIIK
ncbi:GNAT family N-acetyltransferase [Flavobacterium sp. LC2016-12]|uniref:GNAT family N-acetyltransferase n=1 Tax=Flavobacterium sp. LC2016-12 TaxID=2783794 RepID=UPI00188AB983|nr:GNAT family N-acetyltransferase [Flavobacterium sp. LC2016-12]MBF4466214.1 GNAT family N-acetyltransferase [Flavobacterium sp. LC2016-12]